MDAEKVLNTMTKILIIIGIFLLIFTIAMVVVFIKCGSVPDSLVEGVFSCATGEAGIMGFIKIGKLIAKKKFGLKEESEENDDELVD